MRRFLELLDEWMIALRMASGLAWNIALMLLVAFKKRWRRGLKALSRVM